MSEVQTRPAAPRGRGSIRGGRGAFSTRGGRGGSRAGHAPNGDNAPVTSIEEEEDGEIAQLKKKYGSKVDTIKEVFPGWTNEDAVLALQENDGDLDLTFDQISTGAITPWGAVSKNKKDKSKSKSKDVTTASPLTEIGNSRTSRGGRGGFESTRGSRGRGVDRGRGGGRGGRGASVAHTNGSRTKETASATATAEETSAWDAVQPEVAEPKPAGEDSWDAPPTVTRAAEPESSTVSSIIPDGVKKSWASIFKTAPPPPPEPKKAPVPVEKHVEEIKPAESIAAPEPVPIVEEPISEPVAESAAEITPVATPAYDSEPSITPSKDELTETNLEQVLDTSNPPPTATAASTAASSWDPRNVGTPNNYSALQQQSNRTPASGFAATALKATGAGGRSASFQRRVLDQEEAVRMPGNREIDRTTVQFGAFNLNGASEEDIDGDREEPETRAQPPLHSPVAPRASLPPPPQPPAPVQESQPSPLTHARASLPVSQPTSAPGLPSPQGLPNAQNMSQQGSQGNHSYGQYGQYVQAGAQQEQPNQKYEAFAQQAPVSQSPFEGHPSQQAQSQAPPQQPQTTFASAPGEYSPYYASEQQRNNYQSYYGAPYGQQPGGLSQQEGAPGLQQRTASGYSGTQNETASPYPQSSAQQTQSRYATAGEPQTSGHSTPNPGTQAQQQQPGQIAPTQPSQHQAQGQYPYGHPYYSSPYYAAYMNQYQQGYGQGGYGGPYGGAKGGLYNQPHAGYGMSPQTPYDHASSPAAGTFGQSSLHGRESAVGGGLSDYGRTASGQFSTPQALGGGSGAFGMHDTFGRNSSYQGQGQNQHYGQQPNQPGVSDELKPFGDSKAANGPSPSLSQANRPTSATNNGLGQSTLPPPQASQQGYGGYPSHLQQQHALHGSQNSSQYGGLGVGHQAAAGQGHQGSAYGQYPGFGGSHYGGNNQQQRGGWGGNYGH